MTTVKKSRMNETSSISIYFCWFLKKFNSPLFPVKITEAEINSTAV
jgi:hypothetical protein